MLFRSKNLVLLEVAPRIPGSSGLSRVSGVNLPLLSLYDHFNIPVEVTSEKINLAIERTLINRYSHNVIYNKVYIDFDDTLIINDEINTLAVKFLFQCINNRVKIILITRCKGDLMALLDKYRLRNIFDEIIHIKNGEPKSKFIDKSGGVFIDDSYKERKEVLTSIKNIYTLDSSMLSMLIKHSEV